MGFISKLFGGELKNSMTPQQQEFQRLVLKDGMDYAINRMSEVLSIEILKNVNNPSRELIKSFVLEELDAARQGNDISISFVKKSGFSQNQVINKLNSSSWGDNSELETLQVYFRAVINQIAYDMNTMTLLSLGIVDKIMKLHKLGKYSDNPVTW